VSVQPQLVANGVLASASLVDLVVQRLRSEILSGALVPNRRVSCSSTTTCFATSPAGTGTVQVTVTTPFGTSNGVPFTYTDGGDGPG